MQREWVLILLDLLARFNTPFIEETALDAAKLYDKAGKKIEATMLMERAGRRLAAAKVYREAGEYKRAPVP